MNNCRCNILEQVDLGEKNIVLEQLNVSPSGQEYFTYACIQCGYDIQLPDNKNRTTFTINIDDLKLPYMVIVNEFKLVNKLFNEMGIIPSQTEMYKIMKNIVVFYMDKRKDYMRFYRFEYIRKELINFVMEVYSKKKRYHPFKFEKNLKYEVLKRVKEKYTPTEEVITNCVEKFGPMAYIMVQDTI